MNFTCSVCQTNIKVDESISGQPVKCPKCGIVLEIPKVSSEGLKYNTTPATEPQKEYARSLGIDFPLDITKKEISKLIDEAVQRRDDERFTILNKLGEKESKAYQNIRDEILSEIDEEDCRLSKATPSQMVEELENRSLGAILIFFDPDKVDFSNITGSEFGVSFSDNLTGSSGSDPWMK